MTTVPVTDTDRTLFAAIHRPCPGCRWCQTRRVLTAVWRVLDTASMVAMALPRVAFLSAALVRVVSATASECGRWMGMAAAVAVTLAGFALIKFDLQRGHR